MTKKITVLSFLVLAALLLSTFVLTFAEDTPTENTVISKLNEPILCGNSWVVTLTQTPDIVSSLAHDYERNRTSFFSMYGSTIKPEHSLFIFSLTIRNINHDWVEGLSPESFSLAGYLKGKAKVYPLAYAMENTYQADIYAAKDLTYYYYGSTMAQDSKPDELETIPMRPLKMWNLMLGFDVKPILQNWTFTFDPRPAQGEKNFTGCTIKIEFDSVKNSIDNKTYKYTYSDTPQ